LEVFFLIRHLPESEYFAHIHELQHLHLAERGGGGPTFRRADILHFGPDPTGKNEPNLDHAFGSASNQDPHTLSNSRINVSLRELYVCTRVIATQLSQKECLRFLYWIQYSGKNNFFAGHIFFYVAHSILYLFIKDSKEFLKKTQYPTLSKLRIYYRYLILYMAPKMSR
jgi:hypothetical protein